MLKIWLMLKRKAYIVWVPSNVAHSPPTTDRHSSANLTGESTSTSAIGQSYDFALST